MTPPSIPPKSPEWLAGYKEGRRDGIITTCWTAMLNGFFNAKGRKEELYAELLAPEGPRSDPR